MHLWASAGPSAARRLGATSYVLDTGGRPLPPGWGSAARSLEFLSPPPRMCSASGGVHVLIPTIAQSELSQKPQEMDQNANLALQDTRETLSTRSNKAPFPICAESVVDDAPCNWMRSFRRFLSAHVWMGTPVSRFWLRSRERHRYRQRNDFRDGNKKAEERICHPRTPHVVVIAWY